MSRYTFTLLHCLPPAFWHRQRIHGRCDTFSIDAEQLFEIRYLASETRAVAQCLDDVWLLNHSLVSAEECGERILLREVISEKLTKIATVEAGQLIELETGNSAVAQFHLRNGGTRRPELPRDVVLRESSRFAG